MRFGDLRSAKIPFFVCLALFAAMVYFGNSSSPPVLLKGIVKGTLEQEDLLRAVAVDVNGERYVVKFTNEFLLRNVPPKLQKNQEVELMATKFKAVKQGVTCEFVEMVKAGPVRDDLPPDGDESLTIDDLKHTLGYKGM